MIDHPHVVQRLDRQRLACLLNCLFNIFWYAGSPCQPLFSTCCLTGRQANCQSLDHGPLNQHFSCLLYSDFGFIVFRVFVVIPFRGNVIHTEMISRTLSLITKHAPYTLTIGRTSKTCEQITCGSMRDSDTEYNTIFPARFFEMCVSSPGSSRAGELKRVFEHKIDAAIFVDPFSSQL